MTLKIQDLPLKSKKLSLVQNLPLKSKKLSGVGQSTTLSRVHKNTSAKRCLVWIWFQKETFFAFTSSFLLLAEWGDIDIYREDTKSWQTERGICPFDFYYERSYTTSNTSCRRVGKNSNQAGKVHLFFPLNYSRCQSNKVPSFFEVYDHHTIDVQNLEQKCITMVCRLYTCLKRNRVRALPTSTALSG